MEKTKELTLKQKLEQAKANVKELERQMRLAAAKDTVAAMTKVIDEDEHVSEVLSDYTAEEGKIIGQRIVKNFDRLVEKSQDEIKALREKKAEREAKRKARLAEKKAEQKADQKSTEPVKHDDPKPVQTMTEPVKQSEQKPVQQVAQTSAPQVQQQGQQQGQQQVQRPAQPQAAAVQPSAQRQGNAYNGYGQQAQSNGGIRYTP